MKQKMQKIAATVFVVLSTTSAPAFAATLWVKNETNQYLWAYIDGTLRCDLPDEESCTLELSHGRHQLRLERADNSFWQGVYNYKADDIVHCFVTSSSVNCSKTGGLFDDD